MCWQLIVSCAAEADNPEVSQDYHLLRRMIDNEEQFLEVTDLGEELAMQIIRSVPKPLSPNFQTPKSSEGKPNTTCVELVALPVCEICFNAGCG